MKPPANLSDLQRRIDRYRRAENLSPDRLHQRISSEVFLGLLLEAREQGIIPMFLLKGGMAMELRFGIRARASGDIDIGIVSSASELMPLFDQILTIGFAGFSFRRKGGVALLENVQTYRLEIQISYKGKPFSVLRVDLNEATSETTSDVLTTGVISQLGLPGPINVPALEPYLQAAHKLHAATEPSRADYTNNRYRDLLDLLIFARNTSDFLPSRLKRTAVEEFARRPRHKDWPPLFEIPQHWATPLEAEARAVDFPTQSADALEREFLFLIAAIEGVDVKPQYEYRFISLQLNLSGQNVLADAAEAELRRYENEGWKIIKIDQRPGYQDQMIAILERQRDDARPMPRLQLRLRTINDHRGAVLDGNIVNETRLAANKVRVYITGARPILRLGTIAGSDGPVSIAIPYEDEEARTLQQQFPTAIVQFLTDDSRKIQQTGALVDQGTDLPRYAYALNGLGAPTIIPTFKYYHDPLDDL